MMKEVDFVIDGGIGGMIPSTVVDCTSSEYTVIREGLGIWEE
jgi:tRNA A37 threonylcarbamoyladenosine synthetase subunit TsaC/SUA5/YrdC